MRKALLVAVLLSFATPLFSACTIWREPRVHTWRSATGGQHYERLMWQEIQAGNWRQVEMRLSGTFVSISAAGVHHREDFLRLLRPLQLDHFEISDLQVRPAGADTVVTYAVRLRGSYAGRPLPSEPLRMMTVWQQVGKAWVVVAHAAVLAAEGAPPPRPASE